MKKLYYLFFLVLMTTTVFGQRASESWSFGIEGTYPRFLSSDVRPLDSNFGLNLSIQRNFTEDIGLRAKGGYAYIKGRIPGGIYTFEGGGIVPSGNEMNVTVLDLSLDVLYYFEPCSKISPYVFFGFGAASFSTDWNNVVNPIADDKTTVKMNFGIGTEWKIGKDWNLITEFGINSLESEVDGIRNLNRGGFLWSNADAYTTLSVGLAYYFSKGEKSKKCKLYDGIDMEYLKEHLTMDKLTKEDVEEIVKKHIPKEVVKEIVVEKPVKEKIVVPQSLNGINFETGSANIAYESYPILERAYKYLINNPDIRLEVQGHTDNVGSSKLNMELSQERADAVRDYLIGKGIKAERLTSKGYGSARPIASNNTKQGRALNRRIEFQILD